MTKYGCSRISSQRQHDENSIDKLSRYFGFMLSLAFYNKAKSIRFYETAFLCRLTLTHHLIKTIDFVQCMLLFVVYRDATQPVSQYTTTVNNWFYLMPFFNPPLTSLWLLLGSPIHVDVYAIQQQQQQQQQHAAGFQHFVLRLNLYTCIQVLLESC